MRNYGRIAGWASAITSLPKLLSRIRLSVSGHWSALRHVLRHALFRGCDLQAFRAGLRYMAMFENASHSYSKFSTSIAWGATHD
jgi:hypothetical protein